MHMANNQNQEGFGAEGQGNVQGQQGSEGFSNRDEREDDASRLDM